MERIVIVVPGSPDRILAPNRRAHGKQKATPTAQHRQDACICARVERISNPSAPNYLDIPCFEGPVSVAVLVRWAKGERVHDLDSVAVMAKPFIDGIVDAGIMRNDNQMKRLTVQQERDETGRGEVVLTVELIGAIA